MCCVSGSVSPWKLGFGTGPIHEIFAANSDVGTNCSARTSPVSNLPPMLHTHLHLSTTLSEGQADTVEYFILLGSSFRYSPTLSAVDCTYHCKGWRTKTVISESCGVKEEFLKYQTNNTRSWHTSCEVYCGFGGVFEHLL